MPIPSPMNGEGRNAFISRCMDSDLMGREYEDEEQRLGVCFSQWRRRNQNQQGNNMQYIANHITNAKIRRTTFNGRDHIIAPVVLMTAGVHHGSAGRILYTIEELSRMPMTWHGRPVPIMHPEENGWPRSANDPDVLEAQAVGRVFNVEWESGNQRLKGEIWVDEQRAREVCNGMDLPDVINMIQRGDPTEVSTGLFPEDSGQGGIRNNGEEYDATAIGIHADHLALLPSGQGACSWEDGCGVRNQNGGTTMQRLDNQQTPDDNQQQENKKQHSLQANQVSEGYKELLHTIQSKLDGMDNDYRIHFLEELYDEVAIYRVENRETGQENYYRRGYAINDDGSVEFNDGEPEQVRKQVEFVPVQQQQQQQKQDGGQTMTTENQDQGCCPEKVKAVINASANGFTESDREWLQQQNEEFIDKLPVKEPEPATPEPAQTQNQHMDFDTLLQNADSETRESIEYGRQLYQQERDQLISNITKSEDSQFTEDELKAMGHDMLRKIANSIQPKVNRRLQSGVPVDQAEEDEEGLSEPWHQQVASLAG